MRFVDADLGIPKGSGCINSVYGRAVFYRPDPGFVGKDRFIYNIPDDPMAFTHLGRPSGPWTVFVTRARHKLARKKLPDREAGTGHRILQECDRRCPWQRMLAAQMQKSTDEAMAAVSVIITAARPVTVVGKMLEHQVQQLHCLRDFRL